MSQIGNPLRIITVEPLELPIPKREPVTAPASAPTQAPVPVGVPA